MKSDWEAEKLSERFYSCIYRLVNFLEAGKLPQYFNPEINLLDGKEGSGIANDITVLREFLRNPPQLTAWCIHAGDRVATSTRVLEYSVNKWSSFFCYSSTHNFSFPVTVSTSGIASSHFRLHCVMGTWIPPGNRASEKTCFHWKGSSVTCWHLLYRNGTLCNDSLGNIRSIAQH